MSLDAATVARIARLARIEVAPDQLEPLARELSNILGWIEQLGEVETEGVEPMRSVMPIARHWRDDRVTDGEQVEAIVANAPVAHDGFFVVPKVVE